MPIDSKSIEKLSRDELIARATELGARRPELMTRPELRDEIIRLSACDEEEKRRARGWFGVARDLVASVVGQGLHLPDTADLIRGVHVSVPKAGPPVATVTLAEIYAAQGHVTKALDLLGEVITKEPDHAAARQALERWSRAANAGGGDTTSSSSPRVAKTVEPIVEPEVEAVSSVDTPVVEGTAGDTDAVGRESPVADELAGATEPRSAESPEASLEAAAIEAQCPVEASPIAAPLEAQPSPGEVSLEVAAIEAQCPVEASPIAAPLEAPPSPGEVSLVAEPIEAPLPEASPVEQPSLESPEPRDPVAAVTPDHAPDEDHLLIIRTDDGALYYHWQLTLRTQEQLMVLEPTGRLTLRIVEVAPSWDGPTTSERSLTLEGSIGLLKIDSDDANRALRAAIGWLVGERFIVLSIAAQFDWDPQSGPSLRWAPPSTMSDEVWRQVGGGSVSGLIPQITAS